MRCCYNRKRTTTVLEADGCRNVDGNVSRTRLHAPQLKICRVIWRYIAKPESRGTAILIVISVHTFVILPDKGGDGMLHKMHEVRRSGRKVKRTTDC